MRSFLFTESFKKTILQIILNDEVYPEKHIFDCNNLFKINAHVTSFSTGVLWTAYRDRGYLFFYKDFTPPECSIFTGSFPCKGCILALAFALTFTL
jgi:hypothetical protein